MPAEPSHSSLQWFLLEGEAGNCNKRQHFSITIAVWWTVRVFKQDVYGKVCWFPRQRFSHWPHLSVCGAVSLPAGPGEYERFPIVIPPTQCYSWKHSLVILFESPLAAETLIWTTASCTPWNSTYFTGSPVTQEPGGQHGRNHQQESPKWRNEIHFPRRGGLLECNESESHPSSSVLTHTHTLEAFAKPQERK